MEAQNGINNVKTNVRKRKFDLFRPVSVKPDGHRIQSANWCVRFQHKRKRTCRSLGTADYRLATQRAKHLVASVRQLGWTGALSLPTSQDSLSIEALLERYQRSAEARGLRPRSIEDAQKTLQRVARETGVRRVGDLTPAVLQNWVRESQLKPITLRSVLRSAGSVFAKMSLQAMGMPEIQNPFAHLVSPKIDREAFYAPPRSWILDLMRKGIKELKTEARLAFILALGAGLRWGEIVSLTWEDIQRQSVRVAGGKAKGRRARVIPIGRTVREVLVRARGEGLVIRADADAVHETLSAWLRTQGVKDAKPVHYLRKCFGSLAVADHGIFVGSKLLGHSSIALTASTYAGQVDELPSVKF